MRRSSFLSIIATLMLLGCNAETPESAAIPVATSGRSTTPGGLADSEVTDFLLIVRELPGGEFPEFQPAGIPPVEPDQEPIAAVTQWREAYRRSCAPASLAQSWHANADVQNVLARRGYSPSQFADLVRRISLAITAASLEGRINFANAHRQVEQQIAQMTDAIHQLDAAANSALPPQERLRRREAMLHALQETTALAEFLRMLSEIPAESRQIAEHRRTDLRVYLPDNNGNIAQFERIFEMNAQVVPAANWQPQ